MGFSSTVLLVPSTAVRVCGPESVLADVSQFCVLNIYKHRRASGHSELLTEGQWHVSWKSETNIRETTNAVADTCFDGGGGGDQGMQARRQAIVYFVPLLLRQLITAAVH